MHAQHLAASDSGGGGSGMQRVAVACIRVEVDLSSECTVFAAKW